MFSEGCAFVDIFRKVLEDEGLPAEKEHWPVSCVMLSSKDKHKKMIKRK